MHRAVRHPVTIAVAAALIILAVVLGAGYYPVAVVNGHFITERAYDENFSMASHYYEKFAQTYSPDASTTLNPAQIETAVFNRMIDDILIKDALDKELGGNENSMLKEKLDEVSLDNNMMASGENVYGVDASGFQNMILIPEIRKDLLKGRLFLKSQDLTGWLAEQRQSASVTIFSNRFAWSNGSVVAK